MAWRKGNPLLGYWHHLYDNMTAPEVALEPAIAALGERYRSQHPFLGLKHFADFALLDRKLIIEVDGASHDTPKQKKKDFEHMIALKSLGWDVVRVTNESSLADPEGTVQAALTAPRKALEKLQAGLARLLRDYPELSVVVAKKTKPRKAPAPKKPRKPSASKRSG